MPAERGHVLVLAGTREARAVLARAAGLPVLASLAGRTAAPADLGVPTRVGGFGGEDGFRAALGAARAVLDATHPFAQAMTARAVRLCAETGTPYLRLSRPPWPLAPHWTAHPDAARCAAALPAGARVLLATGPGSVAPFLGRGLHLICRRVDPAPAQPGVTWLTGLPGAIAAETALMREHAITHLVAKNAGGDRAKLDAADTLGVAVHLIDRPPPPGGEETHDIDHALAFLRRHADRDRG
ncbi:precorrin-6A/cobalt-precorrin-6A reductase [Jannaschia ovalis]|uniref:Precorrin-6A/cobalt-precorrin-6A reductase n=1 Tax=Jannaschia ovalis TaxID=3038773 RepID=A0ABY8LDU7_9RHOB|nr:precorrin-6A/cobalt-precorrin-6A reductase [Jannaschia sp. GRR-S6-38]WGH78465.1 precorrin-6A/cobalt-precorrin-6A reductase [Jannaschia sp. GRR-S6-38]